MKKINSLVSASMLTVSMMGLTGMMSVAQAKTVAKISVVETYTSHLVWQNGKAMGYVWLTTPNQGALMTWQDFTNMNNYEETSYDYYDTANNTDYGPSFPSSKALNAYYTPASYWGKVLAYSNTVYSLAKLSGKYPYDFFANNLVPEFGVSNGKSVKRLSNGTYLYPNGKTYKFGKRWQLVPESEVPSVVVSSQISNFAQYKQIPNYFFRIPYKNTGAYAYTARY